MARPKRADKVEAVPVDWLWQNRIPRGMISVVAGRPDQGKGLFAAYVAAEVSKEITDARPQGGKVLYSAAEDSHELMTRPRLEALEATLENIALWRFALPENLNEFATLVQNDGDPVDLVIMDPFASHLSGNINRHGDGARPVLEAVREIIEETHTAVLIIEHALKRVPQSGHVLQGIGGTALPQFARTAFVYGKDPDDDDTRVLCPAKFNIGKWPKPLAFQLDVDDIEKVGEVPFLTLDDELEAFDPMRLFVSKKQPNGAGPTRGRPADKRAAAAEWLTNYLAEAGEPVKSGTVQEDAKQYNMSLKTLRRAAEDMGIVKDPPGGGKNVTWDLPEDVKILMGLIDEDGNPAHVEDTPPEPKDDGPAEVELTAEFGPKLDENGVPVDADTIDLSGMDDELAAMLSEATKPEEATDDE